MNFNRQQNQYVGIALIIFGIFAVLRLWWLVLPLLFVGGGYYLYTQRRATGQINEAVQMGLWGLGLGLLFLADFIFPGVLLLAGASLLLRGNEAKADAWVQNLLPRITTLGQALSATFGNLVQGLLVRFRNGRGSSNVPSTYTNSTAMQPTKITIVEEERAATGETVRLK